MTVRDVDLGPALGRLEPQLHRGAQADDAPVELDALTGGDVPNAVFPGAQRDRTAEVERAALFRTDYDDFIETKVRLGVDPVSGRILFQSQNLNKATIEGVEAGWSLDIVPDDISVDGAVYWARGENGESGEPLNSVGPAQAVIGVDWTPGNGDWHTRLRATFTEGWDDRDESGGELFRPPGYGIFDLFVMRALGDRARLRAGVTNLTDKTYWSWSDVRGLGPTDPVIPYLARPGRSYLVGVDMDW